jgi:tetratricopeptide (TPR) repeat protein
MGQPFALAQPNTSLTDQPQPHNQAQSQLETGLQKLEANDFRGAIALLDTLLKQDPKNADAYKLRGAAKFWLGQYPEAIADYSQTLQLDPNDADASVLRAVTRLLIQDYENGFNELSVLSTKSNAFGDCNESLCDLLNFYGSTTAEISIPNMDKIFDTLRTKLQQAPETPNGLVAKGILNLDNSDKGTADLDKAIELEPGNAFAYFFKSYAQYQGLLLKTDSVEQLTAEKIDPVMQTVNKAIELQPHAQLFFVRRRLHTWLGNQTAALSDLNQMVQLMPDEPKGYVYRIGILKQQENYAAAIADLDRLIQLRPNAVSPYQERGFLRFLLGQDDNALNDLNHVIQSLTTPEEPKAQLFSLGNAHNLRGLIKGKQGDFQGAIADFNTALPLSIEPPDPFELGFVDQNPDLSYLKPASSYSAINQQAAQKIGAHFDAQLQQNPDNSQLYLIRGISRNLWGDPEGAIADYNKALALNPGNGEIYRFRGLAKTSVTYQSTPLDRHTDKDDYDQAIALNPKDALAYLLRMKRREDGGLAFIAEGVVLDAKTALALNPNGQGGLWEKAQLALAHHQNQLSAVDDYIGQHPNNAQAYKRRGYLRQVNQDLQGALADYNQALQLQRDLDLVHSLRGIVKYQLQDYQGANADFSTALQSSENPAILLYRGLSFYKLGNPAAAIADYERAVYQEIGPLAAHIVDLGSVDPSIESSSNLIEPYEPVRQLLKIEKQANIQPKSGTSQADHDRVHGLMSRMLGDYDGAIADFDRALQSNPNEAKLYQWRGEARFQQYENEVTDNDHTTSVLAAQECEKLNVIKARAYEAFSNCREKLQPRLAEKTQADPAKLKRAIADYDQSLQLNPKDATTHRLRGIALAALGEPKQQLASYNQAAAQNPQDPKIYQERAGLLTQAGDLQGAIADYTKLLALNSEDSEAYWQRSLLFLETENLNAALQDVERYQQIFPDEYRGHRLRGLILALQGNFDAAKNAYRNSVQGSYGDRYLPVFGDLPTPRTKKIKQLLRLLTPKDPNDSGFYLVSGLVKFELGETTGAMNDLNQAITLNPTDPMAYLARSEVFATLDNCESSYLDDELCQRRLKDVDLALQYNLGDLSLYEKRGIQSSFQQSDSLTSLPSIPDQRYPSWGVIGQHHVFGIDLGTTQINSNPVLLVLKGQSWVKELTERQKIAYFDQAIQLNPNYGDAYYFRAVAKHQAQQVASTPDYTGAISDFDQAIRLKPDFSMAYYSRGVSLAATGELEKAIADFDQVIQLDPEFAEAYYNRGALRLAQGQFQPAIADFDAALQRQPELAPAYANRGIARLELGNTQLAIADLHTAVELFQQRSKPEEAEKALAVVNASSSATEIKK